MGRQFIRDETLSMSRQKTGVPFDIPVLPSLRQELDQQPQSERHLTFVVKEQGEAILGGRVWQLVSRSMR